MGAPLRRTAALAAAHLLCAMGFSALPLATTARADPEPGDAQGFPVLPLPPAIEGLIGLPQTYIKGRSTYLALITREADQRGLPAAIADAVTKVESGFNPNVVGGVGEVGLMQVRPQTAAMLGYTGDVTGLFDPETNVRFGVAYLARAWELARGDVCRTLMKYRAGWGEERMTPLSIEYCRRARGHLAAIGSPLAGGALPTSNEAATSFAARQADKDDQASPPGSPRASPASTARLAPLPILKSSPEAVRIKAASHGPVKQPGAQAVVRGSNEERPEPKRQAVSSKPAPTLPTGGATRLTAPPLPPERLRIASVGAVKLSGAQAQALSRAREQERVRAEKRRQIWVAHEGRMNAITAKLKTPQLKIMSGL